MGTTSGSGDLDKSLESIGKASGEIVSSINNVTAATAKGIHETVKAANNAFKEVKPQTNVFGAFGKEFEKAITQAIKKSRAKILKEFSEDMLLSQQTKGFTVSSNLSRLLQTNAVVGKVNELRKMSKVDPKGFNLAMESPINKAYLSLASISNKNISSWFESIMQTRQGVDAYIKSTFETLKNYDSPEARTMLFKIADMPKEAKDRAAFVKKMAKTGWQDAKISQNALESFYKSVEASAGASLMTLEQYKAHMLALAAQAARSKDTTAAQAFMDTHGIQWTHGKKGKEEFAFKPGEDQKQYAAARRAQIVSMAGAQIESAATGERTDIPGMEHELQNVGYRLITVSYMLSKVSTVFNQFTQSAVNAAMSFNQSMGKIQGVLLGSMGQSTAEIQRIESAVWDVALSTGQSVSQLQGAAYDISSAFPEMQDKAEMLNVTSRLAIAGVTDVRTALKGLITSSKVYGEGMDEVSRYADVMAVTVRGGVIEVGELSAALQDTAPLAAQAGVSFEELSSVIGSLSNVSGSVTEVSTQVKQLISALIKAKSTDKGGIGPLIKSLEVGSGIELIQKYGGLANAIRAIGEESKKAGGIAGDSFENVRAMVGAMALDLQSVSNTQKKLYADALGSQSILDEMTEKARSGVSYWETEAQKSVARVEKSMVDLGKALLPFNSAMNDIKATFYEIASQWRGGASAVASLAKGGSVAAQGAAYTGGFLLLMQSAAEKFEKSGSVISKVFSASIWGSVVAGLGAAAIALAKTVQVEKAKEEKDALDAFVAPFKASADAALAKKNMAVVDGDRKGVTNATLELRAVREEISKTVSSLKQQTEAARELATKVNAASRSTVGWSEFEKTRKGNEGKIAGLMALEERLASQFGGWSDGGYLPGTYKPKTEPDAAKSDEGTKKAIDNFFNEIEEIAAKRSAAASAHGEQFNALREMNEAVTKAAMAINALPSKGAEIQGFFNAELKKRDLPTIKLDESNPYFSFATGLTAAANSKLFKGVYADGSRQHTDMYEADEKLREATDITKYTQKIDTSKASRAYESRMKTIQQMLAVGLDKVSPHIFKPFADALPKLFKEAISEQTKNAVSSATAKDGVVSEYFGSTRAATELSATLQEIDAFISKGLVDEAKVSAAKIAGLVTSARAETWKNKIQEEKRARQDAIDQIQADSLAGGKGPASVYAGTVVGDFKARQENLADLKAKYEAMAVGDPGRAATQEQYNQTIAGVDMSDIRSIYASRFGYSEQSNLKTSKQMAEMLGIDYEKEFSKRQNAPFTERQRSIEDAKFGASGIGVSFSEAEQAIRSFDEQLVNLKRQIEDTTDATATAAIESAKKRVEDQKAVAEFRKPFKDNGSLYDQMQDKGINNGLINAVSSVKNIGGDGVGGVVGDVLGGALGGVVEIFFQLAESSKSLFAIFNWGATIMSVVMSILGPVVDQIMAPLVGILVVLGQVIAAVLLPVLQALMPVIELFTEMFVFSYNLMRPVLELLIDAMTVLGNIFGYLVGAVMIVVGAIFDVAEDAVNLVKSKRKHVDYGGEELARRGQDYLKKDILSGTEGNTLQEINADALSAAGSGYLNGGSSDGGLAGGSASVSRAPDQYFYIYNQISGTDIVGDIDGHVVSVQFIVDKVIEALEQAGGLEARA